MEKLGDVIREHRKLKNLTQKELGERLFVSKQAISKWETGRTLPDIETIQKLTAILEIEPNEILGGTVHEVKKNRKLLTFLLLSAFFPLSCYVFYHTLTFLKGNKLNPVTKMV